MENLVGIHLIWDDFGFRRVPALKITQTVPGLRPETLVDGFRASSTETASQRGSNNLHSLFTDADDGISSQTCSDFTSMVFLLGRNYKTTRIKSVFSPFKT